MKPGDKVKILAGTLKGMIGVIHIKYSDVKYGVNIHGTIIEYKVEELEVVK